MARPANRRATQGPPVWYALERNFADAAKKYLIERAHKASIVAMLHITALLPFIGKRTLRRSMTRRWRPSEPSAGGRGQ
jgi:hypothetical protein